MSGRMFTLVLISAVAAAFGTILEAAETVSSIGRIESVSSSDVREFELKTRDGKQTVRFSKEISITYGKKKVTADELKKGQYVVAKGALTNKILDATEVEMVDSIEGNIAAIMETFPLQLTVKTDKGKGNVSVRLSNETIVFRGKKKLDAGQMKTGDTVRIVGTKSDSKFDALEIELTGKE